MKELSLTTALCVIALLTACSSSATPQKGNSTSKVPGAQKVTDKRSQDLQNDELRSQVEQITSAARGRVGVAALVLESGESVSLNPDEHFPMQSVYKLPIAMALLHQVNAGRIKLEQRIGVEKSDYVGRAQHSPLRDNNPNGVELSIGELLRFTISESDGSASDAVLSLAGGPEAVQAFLNELRVNDIVIQNTEKEIGQDHATQYRNWASPAASIALLRALQEHKGLSEQSQALLLKLMTDTPTGQKRLRGLLPASAVVAHKTGTSGTVDGITAATNDIGLVTFPDGRHLAIAVFVSDSPADEAVREGVIAKVARAVWDKWSK